MYPPEPTPAPLPFARIDEVLTSAGVDANVLHETLLRYMEHCQEKLQLLDHSEDPLLWIEACDYRDTLEGFVELLKIKKSEDHS